MLGNVRSLVPNVLMAVLLYSPAVPERKAPLVWLLPHLALYWCSERPLFAAVFEQMNVRRPDGALAELGLIDAQDYIAKLKISV